MIEKPHEPNRLWWDEVTPVHVASEFYDVAGFVAGRDTLKSIETGILPDVKGKSLLHLQCHFGLDTLSWARRGAKVTGVDFSGKAVHQARELAAKTGQGDARFIEADVLQLDKALDGTFDIIFTSYGAVMWLCDIERWGEIVRRFLKPGGTFLIVEVHPYSLVFDEEWNGNRVEVKYPYFPEAKGLKLENDGVGDYADKKYIPVAPTVEWNWSIAQVQNALVHAGLRLGELKEYPYTVFPQFRDVELRADGYYHRPKGSIALPLLYSLTAVKDA